MRMTLRQSSATEGGSEGHDAGVESAEQSSIRSHWYEPNPYGIYPCGPGKLLRYALILF